jgi:hypothetical protein
MHANHDVFILGIEARTKVVLTFVSKEDLGAQLNRTCAPLDFAPSARTEDQSHRYHFWDFDGDSPGGGHILSLRPEQVTSIDATAELFEPAEFITWSPPYGWSWSRDWGQFS